MSIDGFVSRVKAKPVAWPDGDRRPFFVAVYLYGRQRTMLRLWCEDGV